jgi:hypothetical protein
MSDLPLIIVTLKQFAALEWFGCRGLGDKRPPIIIWRYDSKKMNSSQISETEGKIAAAVDAFQGRVKWVLNFGGRNWSLTPQRVVELDNSNKYQTDIEVLAFLEKEEPELGLAAHQDLPELTEAIRQSLSDSKSK